MLRKALFSIRWTKIESRTLIRIRVPKLYSSSLKRSGFTFATTQIQKRVQVQDSILHRLEINGIFLTDSTELDELGKFSYLENLNVGDNRTAPSKIPGEIFRGHETPYTSSKLAGCRYWLVSGLVRRLVTTRDSFGNLKTSWMWHLNTPIWRQFYENQDWNLRPLLSIAVTRIRRGPSSKKLDEAKGLTEIRWRTSKKLDVRFQNVRKNCRAGEYRDMEIL